MAEQLELFPEYQGNKPTQTPPPFKHTEWCFQFFKNEPIPFARNEKDSTSPLIIQLEPVDDEGLVFTSKGMTFRIFARECDFSTDEPQIEE